MPQEQQTQMSPLAAFNKVLTAERTKAYLKDVLGQNAESFTTSLSSLVGNSAALQQCDVMSVMYCALKAATMNLPIEPNFGFAYVIPYKDNRSGKTLAQFQMGYKGLLQLALRSGQFTRINAGVVHEGELVSTDLLTGDVVLKTAPEREKLPVIGYFAFMRLVNGFEKTLFMTKEAVAAHAKRYSQSYRFDRNGTSVWAQNFDAMAQKTVLKQLLGPYAPLSIEMINALRNDQVVITADNKAMYLDNEDAAATLERQKAESANTKEVSIEEAEVVDEKAGGEPMQMQAEKPKAARPHKEPNF